MIKKLIAAVSAIFLLPVFEKSSHFNDFLAIWHSIRARESGINTVCWKARKFDDSMTYWFPWRDYGGDRMLVRRHQKGARWLGPTGLAFRSQICARPFRPRHSPLSAPFQENTTQMSARPCGPRLSSVANAPAPTVSLVWCLPRGLGRATLDSDHAKCL